MPDTTKQTAAEKAKPYHELASEFMEKRNWTRKKAMHEVQKRHPEARAAFIDEGRERCPGGLPAK